MRIKAGRDFATLKAEGRRLVSGCLVANWKTLPPGSSSRVGLITTRRLGNAVVRNRARRLLRESFRRHQADLSQPVDAVLVARSSIVGKGLSEVERDFLAAMRKARLLRAL